MSLNDVLQNDTFEEHVVYLNLVLEVARKFETPESTFQAPEETLYILLARIQSLQPL